MILGWVGVAIMLVAAFLFGFVVCALFASNSYERGWRDAVRRDGHERW